MEHIFCLSSAIFEIVYKKKLVFNNPYKSSISNIKLRLQKL